MEQFPDEPLVRLKEKIQEFPSLPGVYLMKSLQDKIIYVGKAKNLRARVRSYFNNLKDQSPKTTLLMQSVQNIEYLLTQTEIEAFLLEASLIKKHRPKYNIRLKDDKAYPYLRIDLKAQFPRIYLSRRVERDGSLYFGPYTSGAAVRQMIQFLNQTFLIRDCEDQFMKSRKRPCMTHQIGRCLAPCVGLVSSADYRAEVERAVLFLRGKNKKLVSELKQQMMAAAQKEQFETAAKLRDRLWAIESLLEKQAVVEPNSDTDQDILGFFGDERGTLVETLHVRAGRLIGSRPHFLPLFNGLDPSEEPKEWIPSFLTQYYIDNFIPDQVLLPLDLGRDICKLIEDVLCERSGHKVKVGFVTQELGQKLLQIAEENAKNHFQNYLNRSRHKEEGLRFIQKKFHLAKLPHRIECFDISHLQGRESVASRVCFEDGIPNKNLYRRYRLKIANSDDYQAMREVLTRRFSKDQEELPDLLVIDGGKGQLNIARKVLQELGLDELPVVGLAKSRTKSDFGAEEVQTSLERFFLPNRQNPVTFKPGSESYQILVSLRDEAHRFAINYHRTLREAAQWASALDSIPGLGEQKKLLLLEHFSDLEQIRNSTVEELSKIKGITRKIAETILQELSRS